MSMKRRRALLFTSAILLALCAACGGWLHVQKQQYARNRQLIDALLHNDPKTALVLVNEGADPNTRQSPMPVPSFKLLLAQLLHLTPPVNNSPTALMIACQMDWALTVGATQDQANNDENLPLVKAMLMHGANIDARAEGNTTALDYAIATDRLHTVEWLLSHGANPNVKTRRATRP
jgi:ankyrin repeat protein